MALIACPECSAEVSDRADTCPRCAAPLQSELIIAAPTQAMLINPKVTVTMNGREVARLSKGDMVTVPVPVAGDVTFTSGMRSTSLRVRAGRVTRIQLAWDRLSGRLVAQEVERIGGTVPI